MCGVACSRPSVRSVLVFGSLALLNACLPLLPSTERIAPGTYRQELELDVERDALVHVPRGYDPRRPVPLVIALHGAFETAESFEEISGLSQAADLDGFVVAYPNGRGLLGWLQHWNAGFCCAKAKHDGWDDVGFLVRLIEELSSRLSIDRRRVAVVGFSNGGMLAYRFASERRELVSALVVCGAAVGGQEDGEPSMASIRPAAHPLPVLVIHGKRDDSVPYGGGRGPRHPEIAYLGPTEAAARYVRVNGCTEPVLDTGASGVTVAHWHGCASGRGVTLVSVDELGHWWPRAGAHGEPSGFDATEELRSFLARAFAQSVSVEGDLRLPTGSVDNRETGERDGRR